MYPLQKYRALLINLSNSPFKGSGEATKQIQQQQQTTSKYNNEQQATNNTTTTEQTANVNDTRIGSPHQE
jgi:hypothetical protein